MPPSGHSSSSHSSRSSGSSHASSSRSSSSRSSGGSSRSYSSSGSSSRSSTSFRSSSRPSPYSSGRPSPHSSSSHSSYSAPQRSSQPERRQSPPPRTRHNQPSGFLPVGKIRPSYYRGTRHDYIYYPESWVDESTGTSYESGYYDENGQRYDNVSFEKNGTFENVVCKCEYCGQDSVVNLSADDALVKSVTCPNCGAPMTIRSELDRAVEASESAPTENTHGYESQESLESFKKSVAKKKSRNTARNVILIIISLFAIGQIGKKIQNSKQPITSVSSSIQQLAQQEGRVALVYLGQNAYRTASGSASVDKILVWDESEDCYYDVDTECWLWYNTDVSPALWQYWYEGISSDFGDYGWMEHDADGWWIEEDYGEWIQLPEGYDTSCLWYIDD